MMTPDSGTTHMTMPSWAKKLFTEQTFVENKPCVSDLSKFGTLTFVIDGEKYEIPAWHWVARTIDPKS